MFSLHDKLRRSSRNAAVATGSFAAVAASAAFLIAPSTTAMAATVHTVPKAKVAHNSEIIFGKVTDAAGKPANHAQIVLSHRSHGRNKIDNVVFTNKAGTYRVVTHLWSGTYRITITERAGRKTFTVGKTIQLKQGKAYNVSGKIVKNSVFNFLPISTY